MDYKQGDLIRIIGEMYPRKRIPVGSIAIVTQDSHSKKSVSGQTLSGQTWQFDPQYIRKITPTRLEKLIYGIP